MSARMPGWLKTWLVAAAIVGGGVLLVTSLALFALLAAIVLFPALIWAWLTGRLKWKTDVIEGTARRVEEEVPVLSPFTEEEKTRLAETLVWVVEYRDEFSIDENRDSYERCAYNVAVCFSAQDAQAEANRRGERFRPGWAGFDVLGPVSPLAEFRDDGHPRNVLRVILGQLASGSREPIRLRD